MPSLPPELAASATPGLIAIVVALGLLAAIPGVAVIHTLLARPRPLDVLVLGAPLGYAAVAFATYVWNLVPYERWFDPPALLPVVLGWVTVMGVCRRGLGSARSRGLWIDRAPGEGEGAEALGVALLTGGVFAVYFLGFERDLFAFTGANRGVALAARVPVGEFWELVDAPRALALDPERQTHGAIALLSVLPATLEFLGVRAAFAGLYAGLAACVHVGARRAGASGLGALAASLVAALHPAFLDAPTADVSHVALGASALLFAVLMTLRQPGAGTAASTGEPGGAEGRLAPLGVGVLAALVVGTAHALLFALPAAAVLLWTGVAPVRRRRFAGWAALGLAVGLAPFLVRHALALGHPFAVEAGTWGPGTAHTFAGATFEYPGLLNRPFHPEWVRTPHVPLPAFLHAALHLAGATGTILLGVAAVGLGGLPRGVRVAAALWILPGLVLLFPVEAALEASREQVVLVWAAPALVAVAFGVDALRGARRSTAWATVGVVVLLATVAGRAVVEVYVPPDDRFNDRWPHLREEAEGEMDAALDRAAWLRPWPRWEADGRDLAGEVRAAAEDLAEPTWAMRGASPREHMLWETDPRAYALLSAPAERSPRPGSFLPPRTPGERVVVDLAVPWPGEAGPSVRAAFPEERNVSGFERPRIYDLRLDWLPYAPNLHLFRSARAPWDAWVVLSGPVAPELPGTVRTVARDLVTAPEAPEVDALFHALHGTELVVPMPPESRLHLVEVVSAEPPRVQRWTVLPTKPGEPPKVLGPYLMR